VLRRVGRRTYERDRQINSVEDSKEMCDIDCLHENTSLLCSVDTKFIWHVEEVLRIILGRDPGNFRSAKIIVPTLLLSEMYSIFLRSEGHASSLHVISGAGPSHQRVLPSTRSRQNVPVNAPSSRFASPTLGCASGWLEDSDGAVTKLSRSATNCVCRYNFSSRRSWNNFSASLLGDIGCGLGFCAQQTC